jgi:hypothetical protein
LCTVRIRREIEPHGDLTGVPMDFWKPKHVTGRWLFLENPCSTMFTRDVKIKFHTHNHRYVCFSELVKY